MKDQRWSENKDMSNICILYIRWRQNNPSLSVWSQKQVVLVLRINIVCNHMDLWTLSFFSSPSINRSSLWRKISHKWIKSLLKNTKLFLVLRLKTNDFFAPSILQCHSPTAKNHEHGIIQIEKWVFIRFFSSHDAMSKSSNQKLKQK